MDIQQLEKALQIRYIKLHFGIRFYENTRLPMNKVSAIRGGMGEMLLRTNCIRDRKCEKCDFQTECIVRRTMYSQFDQKPDFVTTGDSVGYVLECENYEEFFKSDEMLKFNLILFGKTIVYFSQFLQALYQLGEFGLGKEHSKYEIVSITNTVGKDILKGQNIFMEQYEVQTIWDYVIYRMSQSTGKENKIRFKTPATLKYQGQIQKELSLEAIISAILRRIYILDCFEGLKCDEMHWCGEYPEIILENSRQMTVYRYSSTQNQKVPLRGVKADLRLAKIPEGLLPLLLAGELIHVGKNTSFGFGRYRVK